MKDEGATENLALPTAAEVSINVETKQVGNTAAENLALLTAAEVSINVETKQVGNTASSFIPHPSSLRILLWDIDGTLIRSVRPDSFKDYTIPMLEEVFGTAGCLAEMQVSGMTDLQIVAEALRDEGF